MANLNRVFLMGNLTRDPEVRYLPSGRAVADLHLAINRKFKVQSGETREETCFVGLVAWGRQAEVAGEYLKKGSGIFVEGRLRYEQWETNGEKHNRLRVSVDRIQFLDKLPIAASKAPQESSGATQTKEKTPADTDSSDSDNLPF